eukprot:11636582-Karenia_brevis.AAC.1
MERMRERRAAEERERVRSASPFAERPHGAYVASPPRPTIPPVAAKPIAKSQIRVKAKAASN